MKNTVDRNLQVPPSTFEKLKIGVIGSRGYSGMELCRILQRHPQVKELTAFTQTSESDALFDFNLNLLGGTDSPPTRCHFQIEILSNYLKRISTPHPNRGDISSRDDFDVVFLATPAEVSMELVPQILPRTSIIDLSGAFRLPKTDYPKWYGIKHTHPDLLGEAHFGLSPWMEVPRIFPQQQTHLISNPGCYATAVLMGLIPLLKNDPLILPDSVAIDAKSGTTGAGKKATENLTFSEVEGNCTPYRIGRHQHLPEIQRYVERTTGISIDPFFSTSLLPLRRGIIVSLFTKLKPNIGCTEVEQAFQKAYAGNSLVQFSKSSDPKGAQLLSLRKVVGTPRTHISYEVQGNKLYLYVCIDNLLKGAASQAIENLNRIAGWKPTLGLTSLEGAWI